MMGFLDEMLRRFSSGRVDASARPLRPIAKAAFPDLVANPGGIKSLDSSDFRILDFDNHGGSLEHYYHFLLGAFLPLVHWISGAPRPLPLLVMRSCGPMDAMVREFNPDGILLLPKEVIKRLLRRFRAKALVVRGLDAVKAYDRDKILAARRHLLEQFSIVRASQPCAVIVNRGKPDPFYKTGQSEIKPTSNERRSIENISEIYAAVRERRPDCKLVELESGAGLRNQIALFHSCDLLIAQHGAALANVIWMEPGARVVEIINRKRLNDAALFATLTEVCSLQRGQVIQEGSHSAVDVATVLEAFDAESG